MTPAARQTYHLRYVRWHAAQERIARRVVLVRLRSINERIQQTLTTATVGQLSLLVDLLVSESDHRAMLSTIYLSVGPAAAEREYVRLLPPEKAYNAAVVAVYAKSIDDRVMAMLTKDKDPFELPELQRPKPTGLLTINPFSFQWRDRMIALLSDSETAQRINQMTGKTRQLVRDVLSRGAEQNWTVKQIARRLRSVVVSPARALLIARTETTRAANVGHEIGAHSTGIKLKKLWIATSDARTRDTHRAMIGSKPIGPEELFTVGGRKMRYPGDPAGGAAMTVNCRCVVSYIPALNPFD